MMSTTDRDYPPQKITLFRMLLFILICLTATETFAQNTPPRFSAGAMILAGKGKMGNGTADAPERDLIFFPLGLFAGVNYKKFRLGLNYEYMMTNQTTDPIDVGNTNTSGAGNSFGTRLEYYDGKQSIGVVYRASTTYNLEKKTISGQSSTYKGSGFSFQFTRQIKNKFGFVIDYTMETFNDSLSSGNIKYDRIGFGIIFSNFSR